jgi:PAS domain S-box-containing protein/diguanylate cyclase (GGDEF)-like protein
MRVSPAPWTVAGPCARLAGTLDALPVAALELDMLGTVLAANAPALSLFAVTPDELLGTALEPYLPIDELRAFEGERADARLEGRRRTGVPVLVDTSVRRVGVGGERRMLCILHELNFGALATEAQRHFDIAFDNAPIGTALFNCDGEYVRVNAALCEMLGRAQHELIGHRDQELTHPDDREADVAVAWDVLSGKLDTHQCEKRFVRPDGSLVWVLASLTFLRDEAGRPLSWFGQFQDITARRAAEVATREAQERFRLAFDDAPTGMAIVSPDGDWLRVNRALCDMTGHPESRLLGSTFQEITHPDDLEADLAYVRAMLAGEIRSYEMEKRFFRADGSVMWILLSVSLVRDADGAPLYFVSHVQDIDARKREHGELELLAHRDALTGTLNRRAWDAALARAVARAQQGDTPLAIALIDLNDFKLVNDALGHGAGDGLLQRAARSWEVQLRAGDSLARIGGDEFAVLLPDAGHADLALVIERLKRSVPHDAGCAIGGAAWRRGDGAAELMRRADAALYADKAV